MNRIRFVVMAAMILIAGCSQRQQIGAAPKMTAQLAAQSVANTEKQIQTIENDPSIPDATKKAVVGHLQANIDRTKSAVSVKS